jgi:uncharacterized protein YbcV (DUF1398 family)
MFTIEQIKEAHSKVKSGADFPNYVQDLIKLGVKSYEVYVADGQTHYFGKDSYTVQTEPNYSTLKVADTSDKIQFVDDLRNHQKGNTNYPTFCNDCAISGIEKWMVNTRQMTCIYYDKSGNEMLKEIIPTR